MDDRERERILTGVLEKFPSAKRALESWLNTYNLEKLYLDYNRRGEMCVRMVLRDLTNSEPSFERTITLDIDDE